MPRRLTRLCKFVYGSHPCGLPQPPGLDSCSSFNSCFPRYVLRLLRWDVVFCGRCSTVTGARRPSPCCRVLRSASPTLAGRRRCMLHARTRSCSRYTRSRVMGGGGARLCAPPSGTLTIDAARHCCAGGRCSNVAGVRVSAVPRCQYDGHDADGRHTAGRCSEASKHGNRHLDNAARPGAKLVNKCPTLSTFFCGCHSPRSGRPRCCACYATGK